MTSAVMAFVSGTLGYVGDRINIFEQTGVPRLKFPGYFFAGTLSSFSLATIASPEVAGFTILSMAVIFPSAALH